MLIHNLTQKLANHVTCNCAQVSYKTIHKYFSNSENSIENIPASLIYNCDGTNVTDSLGAKNSIVLSGMQQEESRITFKAIN